MDGKKPKDDFITKRKACVLLAIRFADLSLFERAANVFNATTGYTEDEFLRLKRVTENFYGVVNDLRNEDTKLNELDDPN